MNNQKRIFIWANPRAVSNAFLRGFVNIGANCKGFAEPYGYVYYTKVSSRSIRGYQTSDTFEDVKHNLEQPFDGHDFVVVKELAYYFKNKTFNFDFIPEGYTHMFLIRKPAKSISSLYIACKNGGDPDWVDFHPEEASYKEITELYELVKNTMRVDPIVVDADDLLNDPPGMMEEICRRLGLPYCHRMVHWENSPTDTLFDSHDVNIFRRTVFKSKGLDRNLTSDPVDESTLPDTVKKAIRDAEPFYQQLYEHRIVLD